MKPKPRPAPAAGRLESLDVARGFVILSMVFVNYLGGMPGIPAWLEHAPAGVDAYTFADLVFPGFLFLAGVAIPFSLGGRLERGEAAWPVFRHVLTRCASLIALGVMMVNVDSYAKDAALLPLEAWRLLAYLGAAAFLWVPAKDGWRKPAWLGWLGLAAFGLALALYRGKAGDALVWLRPQWWGILGIIGWSYLGGAAAYLLLRGRRAGLLAGACFMLALYVGGKHGLLGFLGPVGEVVDVGQLFGTHAAILTLGTVAGTLCREQGARAAGALALYGLGLFLAGQLIRPLHGVSKIGGTDAFALVTSGLNCLALAAFVRLLKGGELPLWARALRPAGRNPLLAYLLPDVLGSLMAITGTWGLFWPLWHQGGALGLLNAAAVVAGVLALAAWLTRKGLALRL